MATKTITPTKGKEIASKGGETQKVSLNIGGMTCASCVYHVERALKGVEGVRSAGVNLATERAVVEFAPGAAGIADFNHAVQDAGYTVLGVAGDTNEQPTTARQLRILALKTGISIAIAAAIMTLMNVGWVMESLPFRLDYILLVLLKEGRIAKIVEKKWNARINVWLRGPSMSIYAFIGWQGWHSGNTALPLPALVLVVFLHFFNGQFYAEMAVGSYHKLKTQLALEKNKGAPPNAEKKQA